MYAEIFSIEKIKSINLLEILLLPVGLPLILLFFIIIVLGFLFDLLIAVLSSITIYKRKETKKVKK